MNHRRMGLVLGRGWGGWVWRAAEAVWEGGGWPEGRGFVRSVGKMGYY